MLPSDVVVFCQKFSLLSQAQRFFNEMSHLLYTDKWYQYLLEVI